MKLYKLAYNGVVVGVRLCEIPSCKYSLDMDLDLAKVLLNLIDKRGILKGGTLPLKIDGNMYVTDNEENVITTSSLNECLKYINNTKEILGRYVNIYVSQRLEEIMPNILQGTKLRYENRSVSLSLCDFRDYKHLFINGENNKGKRDYHSRDYGITFEVEYNRSSREIRVVAEVITVESYTKKYLNGGAKTFYKFLTIDKYDKCVKFDKKKVVGKGKDIVDIRVLDNYYNLDESTKHYYTDKPDFILLTKGIITPTYYFDNLLAPVFEEVVQFYNCNMKQVELKLSSESDILNYLSSFETVSKGDLIKLSKVYPRCYYCERSGTPHFDNLSNTEDHIKEMEERYSYILGFRRYLIWKGNLYLWFGEDEQL